MFQALKRILYFPLAYYFRFFAKIKLARWKPRIIVITGSSGKTTLLHLVESQFGDKASYSYHANSSYGIPFDILGLSRKNLMIYEWLELFLKAPLLAASPVPKQKIYVVEADCDRQGEGAFLSSLLKPEVTIWLSSSRTHSTNFDKLVDEGKFNSVEDAIAYEYGYFLEAAKKIAIVNSDSKLINSQLPRTKAEIIKVFKKNLASYKVSTKGTEFKLGDQTYTFEFLLPEAVAYSIYATYALTSYLSLPFDASFPGFNIPPGRSSVFKGIKNTIIIDSCYNANFSSAEAIIDMFNKIKSEKKWAVIGDMLEQGRSEQEEHEKLSELIAEASYDRVVLLGPRILKYGLPIIKKRYGETVIGFTSPRDVLDYLLKNLAGGELVLFKGARFLEGVIEHLLVDKKDVPKLARREKVWEIRRKKWGL